MSELPGIGFDLIEIERLERAIERRPRLAERLFSEAEIEFAEPPGAAPAATSPRASPPRRRR